MVENFDNFLEDVLNNLQLEESSAHVSSYSDLRDNLVIWKQRKTIHSEKKKKRYNIQNDCELISRHLPLIERSNIENSAFKIHGFLNHCRYLIREVNELPEENNEKKSFKKINSHRLEIRVLKNLYKSKLYNDYLQNLHRILKYMQTHRFHDGLKEKLVYYEVLCYLRWRILKTSIKMKDFLNSLKSWLALIYEMINFYAGVFKPVDVIVDKLIFSIICKMVLQPNQMEITWMDLKCLKSKIIKKIKEARSVIVESKKKEQAKKTNTIDFENYEWNTAVFDEKIPINPDFRNLFDFFHTNYKPQNNIFEAYKAIYEIFLKRRSSEGPSLLVKNYSEALELHVKIELTNLINECMGINFPEKTYSYDSKKSMIKLSHLLLNLFSHTDEVFEKIYKKNNKLRPNYFTKILAIAQKFYQILFIIKESALVNPEQAKEIKLIRYMTQEFKIFYSSLKDFFEYILKNSIHGSWDSKSLFLKGEKFSESFANEVFKKQSDFFKNYINFRKYDWKPNIVDTWLIRYELEFIRFSFNKEILTSNSNNIHGRENYKKKMENLLSKLQWIESKLNEINNKSEIKTVKRSFFILSMCLLKNLRIATEGAENLEVLYQLINISIKLLILSYFKKNKSYINDKELSEKEKQLQEQNYFDLKLSRDLNFLTSTKIFIGNTLGKANSYYTGIEISDSFSREKKYNQALQGYMKAYKQLKIQRISDENNEELNKTYCNILEKITETRGELKDYSNAFKFGLDLIYTSLTHLSRIYSSTEKIVKKVVRILGDSLKELKNQEVPEHHLKYLSFQLQQKIIKTRNLIVEQKKMMNIVFKEYPPPTDQYMGELEVAEDTYFWKIKEYFIRDYDPEKKESIYTGHKNYLLLFIE